MKVKHSFLEELLEVLETFEDGVPVRKVRSGSRDGEVPVNPVSGGPVSMESRQDSAGEGCDSAQKAAADVSHAGLDAVRSHVSGMDGLQVNGQFSYGEEMQGSSPGKFIDDPKKLIIYSEIMKPKF